MHKFDLKKVRKLLALLFLVCPWLSFVPELPVSAQTIQEWSRPENISSTEKDSRFPSIAVDPSGVVHVIWNEEFRPNEYAIYYSYKNIGGGWFRPIDILVAPLGYQIGAPALASDSHGYLHMVWTSEGQIYYSKVYAPTARSVQNWSSPSVIMSAQQDLSYPQLVVYEDNLYLLYAVRKGVDSGIYLIRSTDGGNTWSRPEIIHLNNLPNRLIDKTRLAISQDGTLHVVWVEYNFPDTFPPIGIGYARSEDGIGWDTLIPMVSGPYDDPEITTCDNEEIHLVWSGTAEDRYKLHQYSTDDGKSWSSIWRDKDVGGYHGWPDLVCDSSGKLHWLQVADIYGKDNTLYYNVRETGKFWPPGQILIPNLVKEYHPVNVSAAIASGNELHVVFQYPLPLGEGSWQEEIYYLTKRLDTPEETSRSLPPEPLITMPSPSASPPANDLSNDQAIQITPEAIDLQIETLNGAQTAPLYVENNLPPYIPGLLSAVAVVTIAIVVSLIRQRTR